jgi:CBS domain-containing protein
MNALRIFTENKISGAPVIAGDRVIGIFSESDVMRYISSKLPVIEHELPAPFNIIEILSDPNAEADEIRNFIVEFKKKPILEIMNRDIITVKAEDPVAFACRIMTKHKVNRLPVTDNDGKLIGIVARNDVIRSIVEENKQALYS